MGCLDRLALQVRLLGNRARDGDSNAQIGGRSLGALRTTLVCYENIVLSGVLYSASTLGYRQWRLRVPLLAQTT